MRHGGGYRHADGAVEVGAVDVGAERLEGGERAPTGMPMGVAGTNPDHRSTRPDRREERRVGGRRPVMGHGDHLGRQHRRPGGDEVRLSREFDVAGGQHAAALVVDAQHVRRLVELRASPPVGTAWRRMDDLDDDVAYDHPVTRCRCPNGDVAQVRHLDDLCRLRQAVWHRVEPHHSDRRTTQDIRDATDVIQVGMGTDDQV